MYWSVTEENCLEKPELKEQSNISPPIFPKMTPKTLVSERLPGKKWTTNSANEIMLKFV